MALNLCRDVVHSRYLAAGVDKFARRFGIYFQLMLQCIHNETVMGQGAMHKLQQMKLKKFRMDGKSR